MSCSYEARACGVRAGMFSHEAARRCPQAIFRPGDSGAANRARAELAAVLLEFTPIVEISSIDDFFLDLRGTTRLMGAACEVAEAIQRTARERLHLPITLGIATNKTMARIAGKLGKPGGIAEILPGHEAALLTFLPIQHLPGVGRSIRRSLSEFAIRTAGDLRCVTKEMLFASFGVHGLTLYDRVRGIDPDPVRPNCQFDAQGRLVRQAPKSIHRDSSFEPEEGRLEHIEAMLAYLVERAATRLRSHAVTAGSLEVRVLYVDTRSPKQRSKAGADWDAQRQRLRRKLPQRSAQTEALWQHARRLLRELPRRRALVKRVGVSLLNLAPSTGYQHLLFSDPDTDRPATATGCATPDAASGARFGTPSSGTPAHAATPQNFAPQSRADREAALDLALDQLRDRHGFGSILRGPSMPLIDDHDLDDDGFTLRTPSLNQ